MCVSSNILTLPMAQPNINIATFFFRTIDTYT